MRNFLQSLLLLSYSLFGLQAYAGHETHGGDLVHCTPSVENKFNGYYSLDYLMTLHDVGEEENIVKLSSWNEYKVRLLKILERTDERLAKSFKEFVKLQNNFSDYLKPRIWERAPYGLVLIDPKNQLYNDIDRAVPSNCYSKSDKNEISLFRVVNWEKRNGIFVYSFDEKFIEELDSLQKSFLYVHEWWREFTNDNKDIWRLNRLLHSKQIDAHDYDLATAMRNIGLIVPAYTTFVEPCERTYEFRELMEQVFGVNCDKITGPMLQSGMSLDFSDRNIPMLKAGDLSGFKNMLSINLSKNQLRSVTGGTFHDLSFGLNEKKHGGGPLDLSRNSIEFIESRAFDLINTRSILLQENEISRLMPNSFSRIKFENKNYEYHDSKIDLSKNKLETIETNTFVDVRATVDLSSNQISRVKPQAFQVEGTVNLQHNNLTMVDPDAFQNVRGSVLLDHNEMTRFPEGKLNASVYDGGRTVGDLSLSNNKLESVEVEHPLYVSKLDLSHNLIKEVSLNFLSGHLLDLSYNTVRRIHLEPFRGYLDLSNNLLSSLGEIEADVDVDGLRLNSNQLRDLKVNGSLRYRDFLDVYDNKLTHLQGLEALGFKKPRSENGELLKDVGNVCAKKNLLRNISKSTFYGRPQSQALLEFSNLDLSENEIESIDEDFCSTIRFRGHGDLNLSKNRLKAIKCIFPRGLREIDLSDNQISELGPDIFHNEPSYPEVRTYSYEKKGWFGYYTDVNEEVTVKYLDVNLRNNRLERIPTKILNFWKTLNGGKIYLEGNKFSESYKKYLESIFPVVRGEREHAVKVYLD